MKQMVNRGLALLMVLVMCFSLLPVMGQHAHAAEPVNYQTVTEPTTNQTCILNWGTRGETATFLSPNAEEFYTGEYTYDVLAALAGEGSISDDSSCDPKESELYVALSELMRENHVFYTSNYGDSKYDTVYGNTRYWYQYTDCQNNDGVPYCFYSGAALGAWDGTTWNREHLWPNSKGDGASDKKTIRETDIIMLRPVNSSANSSRGNKPFGESSDYQSPNFKTNGLDMRGDVARTLLYVYVCWGGDEAYNKGALDYMWGTDGVIESAEVLLKWMAADPVDTWEMGRNDSVESITGTRNVFVDYPELAFLLFGEEFPKNWTTPSGEAMSADGHVHNFVLSAITPATCTEAGKQVKTCTVCGDSVETAITATGHNFVDGTCTVCSTSGNAFVIYYPAGNLYLTNTASGAYLASGTAANAAYWNVTVDENDYYVFESNGKYLTSGTTGNALTLNAELTDCGRWEVVECEGGCYLRNIGANYNGNYNQYLEYYSGKGFTVYGFSESKADIYTFLLFDQSIAASCEHSETIVSCVNPTLCAACGTVVEPAQGHSWTPATCKASKTCTVCGATEGQKAGHYFVNGKCAVCEIEESGSAAAEKTVTVVIEDYKNANGWENSKQYKSLVMDGVITATASGGSNSGKYYTKGTSWRFYESDSGKLTITASGATINTVKVTYSQDSSKKGILTLNGTNISSEQVVTVDSSSVQFGVSHDSSSTAGIVYVTAIEVTYTVSSSGGACDHADTKTVGAWDATCTAAGYTGDTVCSVNTCGVIVELGETIPATGHDWSIAATCTTPETCDNCKGTRGEALGHSYTSEVTKEPACNAVGVRTYTCSVCDDDYTEDIPATFEHNYENGACTVCDKVDPNACGHDWAPATCTAPSKCRLCGETTGTTAEHTWVDATCAAPKTCSVCKATDGTALEHASIVTIPGKDASCTETGLTEGKKCTDCDTVLVAQDEIPVIDHTYVDGKCTGCGQDKPTSTQATISFADKAQRTSYSDGEQVWEQNGITVTNVKASSNTNVGDYANPARFYQGSNVTIAYPGMTKIEIDCNHSYIETKHVEGWQHTAAGVTVTIANKIVTIEFTAPVNSYTITGLSKQARAMSITVYGSGSGESGGETECSHSYTSAVTTQPTCTAPGVKTYTCTREGCGHSYTESIPATDHNYVDGVCTVCQAIETEYVTEVSADFTYKLGLYSTDKNNTYYFTGTMNGFYGATSTDYAKGINVYVEETTGGYYLYFIDGSNFKQYINLVTSGTHRNFTFGETAISVFVWDTELNALYTTVKDEICYMGTYGGYVTMGVLQSSKLGDGDYIARLYVMGGDVEICTHINTTVLPGKDATCTETGLTEGSKCVDCNRVLVAQTRIPAKGHIYENGKCSVCGEAQHHYIATVVSEPTCEATGVTLYACDDCPESYTVITKATGHKLADGICTVCGKVFAEDGSSVTVTDDAVEVVLSDKALSGEGDVVALPIPEITVSSSETATAVTIDVSSGKTDAAVKVEIPVAEVTEGTVVVIVHEDGTEEVLKKAAVTENGLAFEVEDKVTVKVVDNTKEFEDVNAGDWSSKAIDFATSREILGGAEDGKFAPKSNMTCLQLTTLLFSMDNNSSDLSDDEVQVKAAEWAKTNHIIDSAFNGEETMTREQLAVFIYRYAGAPKVENSDRFDGFADSNTVSSWARDAMIWAVEVGVINGMGDNTLNSTGKATREQVAQVLMNYINKQ